MLATTALGCNKKAANPPFDMGFDLMFGITTIAYRNRQN